MKILVLNGSPKGEKSNTLKLTTAFLDGLNSDRNHTVRTINIAESRVEHCIGCYACWTKTPGKCVLNDDMAGFIQEWIDADLIIWSFPLYYFGMPSKIKAFLDRTLPMCLPQITLCKNERGAHPSRYDNAHKRHVLISTCGFHSKEGNYDALFRQFEIIFSNKLTKIICPEGELYRVPYVSARTDEYLSYVKKAGKEFSSKGSFEDETIRKLDELLYPVHDFIEMANAAWEIADTSGSSNPEDKSYAFMRLMALIYNPAGYTKDIVLEMYFTDLDKTYQLLLGKEKCAVKTDSFTPYTTRIETPFDVWLKISSGEINGAQGLMDGLYKSLGDFSTMLNMNDYFGIGKSKPDVRSNTLINTR